MLTGAMSSKRDGGSIYMSEYFITLSKIYIYIYRYMHIYLCRCICFVVDYHSGRPQAWLKILVFMLNY